MRLEDAGGVEEKVGTEGLGKLEERHICSLQRPGGSVAGGTRGDPEERHGDRAMVGMGFDRRRRENEVRRRLDEPPGEERFDLLEPVPEAAIGKAARMQRPAAERVERPA